MRATIGHSRPRDAHALNRDQSVTSGRLPTMFVNANIETAVTVRMSPGLLFAVAFDVVNKRRAGTR